MSEVVDHLKKIKLASRSLSSLDAESISAVLLSLAQALRSESGNIITENCKDLALMEKSNPQYDRLLLTKERIHAMADDVIKISELPSPIEGILLENFLPNGLHIQKKVVPLGVVAVIYESRPNVTIDVFALCFKTGNACVLKGGKEAHHSNKVLVELIISVLKAHDLNPNLVYLMPSSREETLHLLRATGLVDVCIPRGSHHLINFVRENAKVPVIETGAGIVHTYFDRSGDLTKGRAIIDNAKTRRVSVCNALDSLLIHQSRINALTELLSPLADKRVEIFADANSYAQLTSWYPSELLHHATTKDFGCEFLSLKMSIKTVSSIDEAIEHIRQYTSGHSEAIISEDPAAIDTFFQGVDASAVYANTSTAFTDGGEFGLGAEIGISTQKLHARGPMGLEALTSYQWQITSDGMVR